MIFIVYRSLNGLADYKWAIARLHKSFRAVVREFSRVCRGRKTRVADEEDVVQEVFESFFAALAGRFFQLHDRHDLWQLRVRIMENKAHDQRKQSAARRAAAARCAAIRSVVGDRAASRTVDRIAMG
jgi:DNA-directed RNA polymerase specialized sigma24 family protein